MRFSLRVILGLVVADAMAGCGGDDCWVHPDNPKWKIYEADGTEVCLPEEPPSENWGACYLGGYTTAGWATPNQEPMVCEGGRVAPLLVAHDGEKYIATSGCVEPLMCF